MGYFIHSSNHQWKIKSDQVTSARDAVMELINKKTLSYEYNLNGLEEISESDRNQIYRTHDEDFKATVALLGILNQTGMEFNCDDEGNLVFCYVEGSAYDMEPVIRAVGEFSEESSFINITAEDGERWRYVVEDGLCKKQKAQIAYVDAEWGY